MIIRRDLSCCQECGVSLSLILLLYLLSEVRQLFLKVIESIRCREWISYSVWRLNFDLLQVLIDSPFIYQIFIHLFSSIGESYGRFPIPKFSKILSYHGVLWRISILSNWHHAKLFCDHLTNSTRLSICETPNMNLCPSHTIEANAFLQSKFWCTGCFYLES